MDEQWQQWMEENIERDCPLTDLIPILKSHGFSDKTICNAIATYVTKTPINNYSHSGIDYYALSRTRITRPHPTMKWQQIPSDLLQIYQIDDFMSQSECTRMIALIKQKLAPSTIGGPQIDKFRTSRTCMLNRLKNPLIQAIDKRISETIGIDLLFSDIIEGQHYDVGQEFKPHHDYFHPSTDAYETHAKHAGNRTWTFMIYLNDTVKGGGTHFSALDRTFYPKTGTAVIWNNLTPQGELNPNSLHWGMPIEEGDKTIITKWFRERPSIPMLLH